MAGHGQMANGSVAVPPLAVPSPTSEVVLAEASESLELELELELSDSLRESSELT